MVGSVLSHHVVNLLCAHACVNFIREHIKNAGIDDAGTTYALNLLWCLNEITRRHHLAALLRSKYYAVHFSQLLTFDYGPPQLLFSIHGRKGTNLYEK